MTVAWLTIVASGLLETVWATCLKRADGFRRKDWLAAGIAIELVSVGMLGWSMQHISLGAAYAAWAGIGTAGTAVAGALFFGERIGAARAALLALLLAGIAGLHASE
jgi:quaternary ammonium compound-resistance protein SugE